MPSDPRCSVTEMVAPGYLVEADGLVKAYRGRRVVDGISINVASGEIVGLLGPNGAGKTTSFYIIVGLTRATAGRVFFRGQQITRLPMYRRARLGMGYLSQEPSIFRKMTVEQNVWAILETRCDITNEEKHNRLEELLDMLGITQLRRQPAYTLSGGERRRTEIARNLALNPKFLLLDEPFAGIDPIAVHEIKGIITSLKSQGIGILITDHNVRDTLDITEISYIIHNGELKAKGTPRELMGNDLARSLYLGENFQM